jgi:hemoglobin
MSDAESPYTRFGGHAFFSQLVGSFYAAVAVDEVLRPMYPEADLGPAAERLRLFLEQYWGGPSTYSAERGHPRLRMRHAPYLVDRTAHDAWLRHMRSALTEASAAFELTSADEAELWDYLQRAAFAMINTAEPFP